MTLAVQLGLPKTQRRAAAELYWQAFGGKLGRVLGPDRAALTYLERVMQHDHVLVATEDGRLVGLAGFKTAGGSFVGGTVDDLRAVYGRAGAMWRGVLLRFPGREADGSHFQMDGVCVARESRGRGIGSRLVEAVCAEARRRGHAEVCLDVIDTNWRAKALYERLGFSAAAEDRIGALRHVYGFRSVTTMVRRITS